MSVGIAPSTAKVSSPVKRVHHNNLVAVLYAVIFHGIGG